MVCLFRVTWLLDLTEKYNLGNFGGRSQNDRLENRFCFKKIEKTKQKKLKV